MYCNQLGNYAVRRHWLSFYTKQTQIIVACMTLHNFIRDNVIYDDDFENYEDEFPEDFDDDVSIRIDEYDMGAFHDSIVAALLS
jgi:hypothetical protein